LGQEEEGFHNTTEFVRRAEQGTPELNPRYARAALSHAKGVILSDVGDFTPAIAIEKEAAESVDSFSVLGRGNMLRDAIADMARVHDLAALRTYLKSLGWPRLPDASYSAPLFWSALESGDWRELLASEPEMKLPADRIIPSRLISNGDDFPSYWPLYAYA